MAAVSEREREKLAAQSVWGASPAGATFGDGAQIGTREFFEAVMERRSNWEQPWLTDIVPFESFRGKRVLELGCGAGYDAYTFMTNGADYTGIDITPENPERVRQHLAHYGLDPDVLEADAERLPFEDESFDVVYSNGVLHHTPDMPRALREARRVLRPGGELYFSVYNRNSIVYGVDMALVDQLLKGGWMKRSLKTRLAMGEYTTSGELPLVNVYSERRLRALVGEAGFDVVSIKVRKLVAEDLPLYGLPGMTALWAKVPQGWLDRLGERWGWYVWAHGSKPSSPTPADRSARQWP